MRIRFVAILALAVMVLLVSSCWRTPPGFPGQVLSGATDGEFTVTSNVVKQVTMERNDQLFVTLPANPTTGFLWSPAQISNSSTLQKLDHSYYPPLGSTPPIVGESGKETWSFKPLKPGTTTVSMDYSRNWQGGEKSVRTFKLTVTVK